MEFIMNTSTENFEQAVDLVKKLNALISKSGSGSVISDAQILIKKLEELKKSFSPTENDLFDHYQDHYPYINSNEIEELKRKVDDLHSDELSSLKSDLDKLKRNSFIHALESDEIFKKKSEQIVRHYLTASVTFAIISFAVIGGGSFTLWSLYNSAKVNLTHEYQQVQSKAEQAVTNALLEDNIYQNMKDDLANDLGVAYQNSIYDKADENLSDAVFALLSHQDNKNFSDFTPRRIDETIEIINGYSEQLQFYQSNPIKSFSLGKNNDSGKLNYCPSVHAFRAAHYYLSKSVKLWTHRQFSRSYSYLKKASHYCALYEIPVIKFWLHSMMDGTKKQEKENFKVDEDNLYDSFKLYKSFSNQRHLPINHEWLSLTYFLNYKFYNLSMKVDKQEKQFIESGFNKLSETIHSKWLAIYYFYSAYLTFKPLSAELKDYMDDISIANLNNKTVPSHNQKTVNLTQLCNSISKTDIETRTKQVKKYIGELKASYKLWPNYIRPLNSLLNTISDYKCLLSEDNNLISVLPTTEIYKLHRKLTKLNGKIYDPPVLDTIIKSATLLYILNTPDPSKIDQGTGISDSSKLNNYIMKRSKTVANAHLEVMCRSEHFAEKVASYKNDCSANLDQEFEAKTHFDRAKYVGMKLDITFDRCISYDAGSSTDDKKCPKATKKMNRGSKKVALSN